MITPDGAFLEMPLGRLVDQDSRLTARALFSWVHECLQNLPDLQDPALRALYHHALDEVWQAGCALICGDLGQARVHTDAALADTCQMQEILRVA